MDNITKAELIQTEWQISSIKHKNADKDMERRIDRINFDIDLLNNNIQDIKYWLNSSHQKTSTKITSIEVHLEKALQILSAVKLPR